MKGSGTLCGAGVLGGPDGAFVRLDLLDPTGVLGVDRGGVSNCVG